jgi:hypothetical protein
VNRSRLRGARVVLTLPNVDRRGVPWVTLRNFLESFVRAHQAAGGAAPEDFRIRSLSIVGKDVSFVVDETQEGSGE